MSSLCRSACNAACLPYIFDVFIFIKYTFDVFIRRVHLQFHLRVVVFTYDTFDVFMVIKFTCDVFMLTNYTFGKATAL
jgi:hypothetical protein